MFLEVKCRKHVFLAIQFVLQDTFLAAHLWEKKRIPNLTFNAGKSCFIVWLWGKFIHDITDTIILEVTSKMSNNFQSYSIFPYFIWDFCSRWPPNRSDFFREWTSFLIKSQLILKIFERMGCAFPLSRLVQTFLFPRPFAASTKYHQLYDALHIPQLGADSLASSLSGGFICFPHLAAESFAFSFSGGFICFPHLAADSFDSSLNGGLICFLT